MLEKFFQTVLEAEEKDNKRGRKLGKKKKPEKKKAKWGNLFLALAIFAFALIPRLIALFQVVDPQSPGWYDDTFHHWQVAYLSKTVGFKHGFLRLWDLKGMEYFWGLLHPLVLIWLFGLTGSISILVPRLLTVFCGSMVIVFLFFLIRRYFGQPAAFGTTVWASLMPVAIYADAAGLQEPLALALVFGGLLLWPKKSVWTGFLFGLAGMIRAEYWLFGLGLFGAALISKAKFDQKALLAVGWLTPIIVYLKYLLNQTGNAIYPIYWNFLASVKGDWFLDVPMPPGAVEAQLIARAIFVFGLLGAVWILVKRPRHFLLFLLGFGNIFFLGFMLGFGAYIKGYVPRVWVDRLFAWPYTFGGILLSVLVLAWFPRRFRAKQLPLFLGGLVLIAALLVSQFLWLPIHKLAQDGHRRYLGEKRLAQELAGAYQGGTILIPEDRVSFVYFLVHDYHLNGENLLGQMFDPFYYWQEDPFLDWSQYRQEVIDWLKEFDVRLILVYQDRERYQKLINQEPEMFQFIKKVGPGMEVYALQSG
jgi:hypothetical protein